MDLIFVGLAALCLLLSGGRSAFLWLVASEFVVSAAWINLPISDPWWFLSYAGQNCLFVGMIMWSHHRLAKRYAVCLLLSALIAVTTFCEYYIAGDWVYTMRPTAMAWICVCQLWLAAQAAGMMEQVKGRTHGVPARGGRRIRHASIDHPSKSLGRRL